MSSGQTDSFGKALRAARLSLGLTQEDAAERLGIGIPFYGRIERGHGVPSMATLVRMVQVLGVSANALMGRPGRSGGAERPQPERPEVRRIVRKLRKASPNTIRVVTMVLDGLGIPDDEED